MKENRIAKILKIISLIIAALLAFTIILISASFIIINQRNGTIISSGQTRKYILYEPESYDPTKSAPLVISLHGFSDWPAHHQIVSGWNAVADEFGFLVVYPMGTSFPLRWRAYTPDNEDGSPNSDVVFISDLIDKLLQDYNIDEKRVYANGLSNGGGMSHLLACTLEDKIVAVGGVAGAYLLPWEECQTSRAVPAMLFHGTADEIVPFNGGESSSFEYPFPAISDFAEQWALRNGCDLNADDLPSTEEMHGIRYSECDENAQVVFYTVEGGGHSWPGGGGLPKLIVGHTTKDLHASKLLWDFYQQFALE